MPSHNLAHIQIFDVSNNCSENDFFDVYTPNDTHVYYGNKIGTTAELDFDNTAGYGPENIFVEPGESASGEYHVSTVFYSGSVPTTATFQITSFANTPNETVKIFTRYLSTASSSTQIDVAIVDFPSGNITEKTGKRIVNVTNEKVIK